MTIYTLRRPTIYQAPQNVGPEELRAFVPDAGRRRYLSYSLDFDTRALMLSTKAEEHWNDQAKELSRSNQERIIQELIFEFGQHDIDRKIDDFIAIDTKPFSVIAYHNAFFTQIRNAFVMGQYYAALVGACALGERILNHLMIDMRDFYKSSPEYKKIHKKKSFDDWDVSIETLDSWGVLLPDAVKAFRDLKVIRHRSIHFNVSTYATLRDDALAAILYMRKVIDQQFGSFGRQPWFIEGTKGQVFLKRSFETNPFVKIYFLPRCAFVGPLFGIRFGQAGCEMMDVPDYGDGEWTDEEFACQFNERNFADVLQEPPEMRWAEGDEPQQ